MGRGLTRWLEDQIDDVAYPAKVSAPVKRLLVVKLADLKDAYDRQREALNRSLDHQTSLPVSDEAMPPELLAKAVRSRELRAELKELEASVPAPYELSYGSVMRRVSEEERSAKVLEHTRRVERLETAFKADKANLEGLVTELARAQVAQVKVKIPPALLTRLDAIGPSFLLGSGEVVSA